MPGSGRVREGRGLVTPAPRVAGIERESLLPRRPEPLSGRLPRPRPAPRPSAQHAPARVSFAGAFAGAAFLRPLTRSAPWPRAPCERVPGARWQARSPGRRRARARPKGDQLAAEGFGEDGLGDFVSAGDGDGEAAFDAVIGGEEGVVRRSIRRGVLADGVASVRGKIRGQLVIDDHSPLHREPGIDALDPGCRQDARAIERLPEAEAGAAGEAREAVVRSTNSRDLAPSPLRGWSTRPQPPCTAPPG